MIETCPVIRPPALPGVTGTLSAEFFQIAYVTTDLDRAVDVMRARYGIRAFTTMTNDLPDGGKILIALAWIGGVMVEVIEARTEGGIYRDILPRDGFAIRHHHFGYFVHGDADWDALDAARRAAGLEIAFAGEIDGFLRFAYIHLPELGHYIEYIQPRDGGRAFFEGVARG